LIKMKENTKRKDRQMMIRMKNNVIENYIKQNIFESK